MAGCGLAGGVSPAPLHPVLRARNIEVLESPSVLKGGLWSSAGHLPSVILFHPDRSPIFETRRFIEDLQEKNINAPVILCLSYSCSPEDWMIRASVDAGSLLCDRLIQGICLLSDQSFEERVRLSYQILQSARLRITKQNLFHVLAVDGLFLISRVWQTRCGKKQAICLD